MIRVLFLGLVLYATCSFQVIASEDRALFWRVDAAEATVYLFGSIHFADESFYPLRAEVEQAFESSDTLVVEVDINSAESVARFQSLMLAEGSYSGDETLKDHLSEKTYNELQVYLKKLGVPAKLIEKQKPGIVVLTLAALQAKRVGLQPEMGIDAHFLNNAKKRKKILALETMDEQLKIFLDIKDGDLLLRDSFYSLEILENEMATMIEAWKQGDEKAMNKQLFDDVLSEHSAFTSLYESLYFQRNINMTEAIKGYLNQKGKYFVVVGAGHLIGDKGIVQLLTDAGYRVTRL